MDISDELARLADRHDIDLDDLDETMREVADESPDSVERALLASNVPREIRLRVGLLISLALRQGECLEKLRAWLEPLYRRGRAGRTDLHEAATILGPETLRSFDGQPH